jgi:GH43 family beta-xylosidase
MREQAKGIDRVGVHSADPSVIRVGSTYISAEITPSDSKVDCYLATRQASSPVGLGSVAPVGVINVSCDAWAPKIHFIDGYYYIYWSEPSGSNERVIWTARTDSNDNANFRLTNFQRWVICHIGCRTNEKPETLTCCAISPR